MKALWFRIYSALGFDIEYSHVNDNICYVIIYWRNFLWSSKRFSILAIDVSETKSLASQKKFLQSKIMEDNWDWDF